MIHLLPVQMWALLFLFLSLLLGIASGQDDFTMPDVLLSNTSVAANNNSPYVAPPTARVDCNPCIERESYTIQVIVHGPADDGFWQQVAKSMRQSAQDMRVNLVLELKQAGSSNNNKNDDGGGDASDESSYSDEQMADDIRRVAAQPVRSSSDDDDSESATAATNRRRPDALIVTIPSAVVERAVAEVAPLLPVFGLNSGYERAKHAGVLGFVSMDGTYGIFPGSTNLCPFSVHFQLVTHIYLYFFILLSEYLGGSVAAEEFISQKKLNHTNNDQLITRTLFVNHAKGNDATEARYKGFVDRLAMEYTNVTVEELVVDLAGTSPENLKASLESRLAGCSYDAVLLAGSFTTFRPALAAIRSQGCSERLLLGTFDANTDTFDAIAVGDLAFTITQQQHLQGALSVALASVYATTGKTLARSSQSEFGVYSSGPKLVNLHNLPSDSEQSCEAESFPVCSRSELQEREAREEFSTETTTDGSELEMIGEDNSGCPCTERSKIVIGGVLHGGMLFSIVYRSCLSVAYALYLTLVSSSCLPQKQRQAFGTWYFTKLIRQQMI